MVECSPGNYSCLQYSLEKALAFRNTVGRAGRGATELGVIEGSSQRREEDNSPEHTGT